MVGQLILAAKPLLDQIKLLLALSRTPHGLLDVATPALGALLCLRTLPPLSTTLVGLITVFGGYTAVYALNDLVDYRADKAKLAAGGLSGSGYLDGIFVRHPLAQGLISFKEGLLWVLAWALVALLGAWWLNPVCAWIFIAGCVLEAIYCQMLEISPWRTIIAGVVKTLGGLAAAYAVNPQPSPLFLSLLFLFIFFWEIGGQNIPADWHDLDADRAGQAQTLPLRLGYEKSSQLILGSLSLSLLLFPPLLWVSPLKYSGWLLPSALGAGVFFLILPALRLSQTKQRAQAITLFNQASYLPLIFLLLTIFSLIN
jgi:4-hydroxybenzoate polyprenyltransferase